ncbi:hypothetical protein JOQ06_025920, partial [Pogonophryne albipinna]
GLPGPLYALSVGEGDREEITGREALLIYEPALHVPPLSWAECWGSNHTDRRGSSGPVTGESI